MAVEAEHAVRQTNGILELEVEGYFGTQLTRWFQYATLRDDFNESVEADHKCIVLKLFGDADREEVVFINDDLGISQVKINEMHVKVRVACGRCRHANKHRGQAPAAVI